ncbi:hypothetical protein [Saccharothrix xinjiangensis]|uniref:Cas3 C-terminal domain-containing protein n=1 Tax=Saccharothrix xinjiangensis TaxID=204798 RepID=A0ABV9YEC7_9PSEU
MALLKRDPSSGAVTTVSGTESFDLAGEWLSPSAVAQVLDDTALLSAPDGVSAAVVRALREDRVPAAFAAQPWLSHHRALVFDNGCCRVGDSMLHYDKEFGVYTDEDL